MLGLRRAEIVLRIAHLRQHGARHAEPADELTVPFSRSNVVEHGAGGVGRIRRMQPGARHFEQEKAVNCSEADFTRARPRLETRHMLQEPGELGRGEIGIDHESRRLGDMIAPSLAQELAAKPGGAAVLPNDRVGERPRARALPYHARLALIGDADGGDTRGIDAAERCAAHLQNGPPDLLGVVLDLARRRVDLRKRGLRARAYAPFLVEQDRAGARRPLVDGEDETLPAHVRSAPAVSLMIQPQYSTLPPSVGSTSRAGSS